METTNLTSYHSGYDDYCEPKKDIIDYEDYIVDDIIDEAILERGEE